MEQLLSNHQAFWQNKRVIVTGGSGFLGSFVVEKLESYQAAEIIIPRSSKYDLVQIDGIKALLEDTAVAGKPVDMVVHLAANVGGIGANRDRPAEFFYNNLMMGVQLLHESWQANVPKFVAVGTVCSYPKYAPIPFKEDDLWNGYPEETNAPYGLAKKMMLVQSQTYREQYGYNSIFLMPVNLYGPRDNFDLETSHVIPALIRKCIEAKEQGKQEIIAWGDGSPTREFLYAEDAARGILLAAERYNQSIPVNLGSSYEVQIKDLLKMIVDLTGFEGEIAWDISKPNGQPRRKLNIELAEKLFGFCSQVSFQQGLQETINWYRRTMG